MGDYIEREGLLDEISAARDNGGMGAIVAGTLTRYIKRAPAADVRPVVRGRWIEKPYLLGTTNVCSVCGENYGMPHGKYNFCPHCGADMRGGGGDGE